MPDGVAPTGTVTLLFTDIEGSTKLWEAYPDAMRVALARHDALLRAAIADQGGFVFKTIGDAFCAVFSTAAEGAAAMLNAQVRMVQEAWPAEATIKVRMALHTGAVEHRDEDYFGPPLNRVARLLSTAHGGQCLLSHATYELVRDTLPPATEVRSLGEHRLRDLGRPENVFQLLHPSLPAEFPPLRSLGNAELRHNLPEQLTSFIGREEQLAEVKSRLQSARLVTLTGSGGSGKTRLAMQVAADLLDGNQDGVWFVALDPIQDGEYVARGVAEVLGLPDRPDQTWLQNLTAYLRDQRVLLILDNCEHLLDACANLADTLLRSCPQVRILATSREALRIRGEDAYRIPSLSLPNPTGAVAPEQLAQYESVRLFIERAAQAQSGFAVTNENAPALASICHRLDGIPLAIELAAARVRTLSLEEINRRLDQRFRLLTGGPRAALPRQQTLRSLVDWSYDALLPNEKALLARLSIFAGGFSLEMAEKVAAGEPVDELDVLDLLTSLYDKSLLVVDGREDVRYRLLETIRQYAWEKLTESGEQSAIEDRHTLVYRDLSETARPYLRGPQQREWLARLEVEHDNFRSALARCLNSPARAADGLRTAAALWRFWLLRGHISEGRRQIGRALEAVPDADPEVRARALNAAAVLAETQGDFETALTLHEESLRISRQREDAWATAMSLNNLGNVFGAQSRLTEARVYWDEALVLWRQLEAEGHLEDARGLAATLDNLGNVALSAGDHETALARYQECLSLRRQAGNASAVGFSLINLASLFAAQGDEPAARANYWECLDIFADLGDPIGILLAIEGLAIGRPLDRAARLYGAAERLRDEVGMPLSDLELAEQNAWRTRSEAEVGKDVVEAAWQEGRTLSLEAAVALARTPWEAVDFK